MATVQFKLPIGAKRQVTIPMDCMDLLSLEEGGELLLEIVGDHAVLLPVVSIPRRDLPDELRKKFEARRGKKPSDLPLGEFLAEIGDGAPKHGNTHRAAPGRKKSSPRNATAARTASMKPR
jgi:bifunctional DNA-binding transcriptional regulator/antitoxin component of YhaV-PrlF toxin-antitoxin module